MSPEDLDEAVDDLLHLVETVGNSFAAEPVSGPVEGHDRHQVPGRIANGAGEGDQFFFEFVVDEPEAVLPNPVEFGEEDCAVGDRLGGVPVEVFG